MTKLTDLEELIESVSDSEISEYLHEAYRCYGSGAYRATIVIVNIALFEGLLRKLRALSPVSKVCKQIVSEIGPLAEAQKVFETPLIHALKKKKIITEFEAQRLEQLNTHRNKAAHPSGHHPTAEEARFVFSDAVNLFLSKPIRQSAYLVDEIAEKLTKDNLFPTVSLGDTKAIVSAEVENLDDLAWPFLATKLSSGVDSEDKVKQRNAESFCLGVCTLRAEVSREAILGKLFVPRLTQSDQAKFLTEMLSCDPFLISELTAPQKLQLDSLLVEHATNLGVDAKTSNLQSPTMVATRVLSLCGEDTLSHLPLFEAWLQKRAPLSLGFINALKDNPQTLAKMTDRYEEIASSSSFDTANRFAKRLEDLDEVIASIFDGKAVFGLIAGFVKSADIGAFESIELVESGFKDCPKMQEAALEYSKQKITNSRKIIKANGIEMKLSEFRKAYLV